MFLDSVNMDLNLGVLLTHHVSLKVISSFWVSITSVETKIKIKPALKYCRDD